MLRTGLETILNVQLSDLQWMQASLPVHMGGLGVRSAYSLASSAFLAVAAATLPLQDEIHLASSLADVEDKDVSNARATWNGLAMANEPIEASKQIQRAWHAPIITVVYNEILARYALPVGQAHLKALSTPHAGDWLHAPPLTAVGLRLSDEAIRVATGFRLGTIICQPHICVCGTMVDARGLHSLACRKSAPRHIRHSKLNDLIWRAIKKAHIPASKAPIGLSRNDGKRPDGATLVP